MRTRTLVATLPIACLLALADSRGVQEKSPIERLSWLSGCWRGVRDGRETTEQWTAPRDGSMLGIGRSFEAGKMVEFEYMRIEQSEGRLVFFASPSGRGEVSFAGIELTDQGVAFSNPDHDFPRVVRYTRVEDGAVLAHLLGEVTGRPKALDLRYERVPCGDAALQAKPPAAPVAAESFVPGSTTRKPLDRGQLFDDVPCRRGYAYFHDNGRLASCRLWGDHAFGEVRLPAGTSVDLDAGGKLVEALLPGTSSVAGHSCRGQGDRFPLSFHPNGRLARCWLAGDEEIDGVPCAGQTTLQELLGRGPQVEFWDNGRLRSCTIARGVTLPGRAFRKGDRVALDPEGKLAK